MKVHIGICIKILPILHGISTLNFVKNSYKIKEISGFSIDIIVIECFTNVNREVIMNIIYHIPIPKIGQTCRAKSIPLLRQKCCRWNQTGLW